LIAWIKLDLFLVIKIHKHAAKAASGSFRTANLVPKLARDRKISVDRIFMEFKRSNPDFRYLVCNGKDDIYVMVKRLSELDRLPYRNIPLENLGAISSLKPKTTDPEENKGENSSNVDDQGFISPRKFRRPDYIPKEEIFMRIKNFLYGFENDA